MAKVNGDPPKGICKACKRRRIYKSLRNLCYQCFKSNSHGRTDDEYVYHDTRGLCSKEQERQGEVEE
jgi:hypothetical protein